MSLIDDAKRLLMIGYDEPIGAGVPHPDYLICRGPATYHAEDCPWGRRERIVQALEAAERAIPFLEDHRDEGPDGAGWQSDELRELIRTLKGDAR